MSETPIILFDSPEAAAIKTVSGWVSRAGRFFGDDERLARYDGCTHRMCDTPGCDALVRKESYTICDSCRQEKAIARYEAKPKVPWDGKAMLFSDAYDEYFSDMEDAEEYAEIHSVTMEDLRLLICEPNYLRVIDPADWDDDLPEDGELPDEVAVALDALNKVIRESGPVSWSPGKFAVDLYAE